MFSWHGKTNYHFIKQLTNTLLRFQFRHITRQNHTSFFNNKSTHKSRHIDASWTSVSTMPSASSQKVMTNMTIFWGGKHHPPSFITKPETYNDYCILLTHNILHDKFMRDVYFTYLKTLPEGLKFISISHYTLQVQNIGTL